MIWDYDLNWNILLLTFACQDCGECTDDDDSGCVWVDQTWIVHKFKEPNWKWHNNWIKSLINNSIELHNQIQLKVLN